MADAKLQPHGQPTFAHPPEPDRQKGHVLGIVPAPQPGPTRKTGQRRISVAEQEKTRPAQADLRI